METLARYLAVAVGGALGAMLRYYLGGSILSRTAQPFPTATFVTNITGSFAVGFFLTLVTERIPINPHLRLAVAVGFIGAYTTFSTFEYETAKLIEQKDYLYAFLNVVLSFVIGFGAVWGGMIVARELAGVSVKSHAVFGDFEGRAKPDGSVNPDDLDQNDDTSTIESTHRTKSEDVKSTIKRS